ncbi:MAG: hydroxymethylglutaryl-CoA reductase [Hyphomicrobiales bacterium]|nr:hydroxymethylglutaryl-CoA reductase [Hyphomicrobiales bacterium]
MKASNHNLQKLYNRGSLRHEGYGVSFSLRNRFTPMSLKAVNTIAIDGNEIDLENVELALENEVPAPVERVMADGPLTVPLGALLRFAVRISVVEKAEHDLLINLALEPGGSTCISARDEIKSYDFDADAIPRSREDDYSADIISRRHDFLLKKTGISLEHVAKFSFDPHLAKGNIENFTGVAQVPIGFAGPLDVDGEYAKGEFYVPLAATEGTLVASYNRGMKLLRMSGGAKCTVIEDHMQRAPVFAFCDARAARRFRDWLAEVTTPLRETANATDRFVNLQKIECHLANRFVFVRFNFTTGDAAGQNMVGKATFAACNWILQHCRVSDILHFYLEGNTATDKKPSLMNTLQTRGKRVTAEATIPNSLIMDILNTDAQTLHQFSNVANIGSMLSGSNNNGCHSINAVTAIFLATGQDVANVSESSAALIYTEITESGDLYLSVTLPSLIVATCGGGTGLPTQQECLRVLGCTGADMVHKLAEIVAATVLAGELSLAGAITAFDWVASHEAMGRNAPIEKAPQ